ncbi:hypothetical protein WH95_16465 [Kiloniella litopenaei]|uniref:HTH araC/xylS-type domain-containing protein n=1 Tax=Kiloniella litopenaei TaxID=1549748 RepID=A0A0M2R5U8_9PROT|nr:AraC family transcriptional regulator [Kiloniella litopenaei]KKJ75819.1 hypothetical protein WH95_16465 [Kiloniella litopenaei]
MTKNRKFSEQKLLLKVLENHEIRAVNEPSDGGLDFTDWIRREDLERGLSINRIDKIVDKPVIMEAEGPPVFSLVTFFSGEGYLSITDGKKLKLIPNTLVLFYSKAIANGRNEFYPPSPLKFIEVRFNIEFLQKIIPRELNKFTELFVSDYSVPSKNAWLKSVLTPPEILPIMQDLWDLNLPDSALKTLYLKGKALEVLSLVIQFFEKQNNSKNNVSLSPSDKRKIYQARELLEKKPDKEWQIAEISRTVGINERKLKFGFRSILGASVYASLQQIRMELAINLLLETEESITDIALTVGYSNPSHFSQLFKRYYKCTPKQYRYKA